MAPPATEPTAGWFDGRTHHLPVRVYYEDTDFTGVVYHASYVRFFERGRSDFLRLAGIGHRGLLEQDEPMAFAVTRLAVDFKRAARIDDALVVKTTFDAIQGPRILISESIWRDEALIAQAQLEIACIDLSGRARRPPPVLAQQLRPYLTPAG